MTSVAEAELRVHRPRIDVVGFLTIWILLLFGINARQVVPGFGAIGSPAMLLAQVAPLLWAAGWVLPRSGLRRDPHPMRAVLLLLTAYLMFSFAVAMSRPVSPLEITGALRALLIDLAMVGIALLVADGVANQRRLEVLLRRLVHGATFVAVVGILQFLTNLPFDYTFPGLQWNTPVFTLGTRSIFGRPASTSMHPIEFSVVTAGLLPLAIHFAMHGRDVHQRRNATVATGLMALAVPMSISRSGILSIIVALGVLALGWNWAQRLRAAIIAAIAVPVIWASIPGLVGTIISLFSSADYDPSVQDRISRRPRMMALIRERPWFGLGNGTWSIEDYFLVDSELYVSTLELGFVGIVLVLGTFVFGIVVALSIRSFDEVDEGTRHLGLAIAASIGSLSISVLTFDAFHYRQLLGSLFLLLGAAGALWRLHDLSARMTVRLRRTSSERSTAGRHAAAQ